MKKLIVLIGLFSYIQIVAQTDASIIKVDFQIKNAGITVDGHFDSIQAQLYFKKNKWESASISGKVYAKTIKTGIALRDKHLINDDYFDTETYPFITLNSISLKEAKKGELTGKFNLRVKETTQLVEIPITYTQNGKSIVLKGQFSINRQEFGVGGDSFVLADDVLILFEATFPK